MKLLLKELRLDNYKCYTNPTMVTFSPVRTIISGKNGSGKSTMYDAYLDILTGKLADGTVPDGIRPQTADGKDANRADIIRAITVEKDGEDMDILKRTKQLWRVPRGGSEEIFEGNSTEYEIDGFVTKSRDYDAQIAAIAPADILAFCSNPKTFIALLGKSTAEARKALETIAGFDMDDFIAKNPEFAQVAEICKGHPVDDTLKKLRKQLTAQKKMVESKRTEVKYESGRTTAAMQYDEEGLKAELADLEQAQKELNATEADIADRSKAYERIQNEAVTLRGKLRVYVDKLGMANHEASSAARDKVREAESAVLEIEQKISGMKTSLSIQESARNAAEEKRSALGEEWKRISQMVFDENERVCAFCGQPLPQEKQDEAEKTFTEKKQKKLEQIVADGTAAKQKVATADDIIATLQKGIRDEEKELKKARSAVEKAKKAEEEVKAHPAQLSPEDEAEKDKLNKQIDECEEKLKMLETVRWQRTEVSQNITNNIAEQLAVQAKLKARADAFSDREKRVKALEKELKALIQGQADIEREIDQIQEFSRAKNAALAGMVNPFMDGFEFSLIDYTIDGNPVDTCHIIRNGIDYTDLNYSDRLIVEANMARGFQKMNDLALPIWIDNAESINENRIPNLDTQMIILQVTDKAISIRRKN